MSVALSLAQLRASNSSASSRGHVPPQPRRDMAGLALNGLDTLSTIDPNLQSLAPSLLLFPPYPDRATLPPDEANAVSSAVLSLAIRLAPVLPLRPAQKIISWLIHGLRVPQLGREQEVDAIMLSALPFHATPQFLELTTEVLRPRRWKKWEWLRPVVKQKKPASLELIVRDCPETVLRLAIGTAVEAVGNGVNAVSIAGFLVNVLVRRLSGAGVTPRRELLLAVVDALVKTNRLKVKVKEQVKTDLLCALLSAVAAAVPAGIETEIASAAAQAAAMVVRSAEVKSPGSDTAAACLALLVTQSGVTELGKEVSRGLIKDKILRDVLPRLHDDDLIKATYAAAVLGLLTTPSVRMLDLVGEAVLGGGVSLLSDKTVAKILISLLDLFSSPTTDFRGMAEEKQEAMRESLMNFLSRLARGRFAEGVDTALREHLNGRKKSNKTERGRYVFLDDVIEKALSGTAFDVVREAARQRSPPKGDTVLATLSHPEPSVRKASLGRLLEKQYPWDQQDMQVSATISEKCCALLKDDPDPRIAADAAMCVLRASSQEVPQGLLRTILTRFRQAHSLLLKKKKRKKSRKENVIALGTALVSTAERSSKRNPVDVQAILIGLAREGTFKEGSALGEDEEIMRRVGVLASCKGSLVELSSFSLPDLGLTCAIEAALESVIHDTSCDHRALVNELSKWEPAWGLDMVRTWLNHRSKTTSTVDPARRTPQIVDCLFELYEKHDKMRKGIMELIAKNVKPLFSVVDSKSSLGRNLDQIWDMFSCARDEAMTKQLLREITKDHGLGEIRSMLQRSVAVSQSRGNSVRGWCLDWFLALCENDSKEDLSRDAVLTVLSWVYSDDMEAREEARRICNARRRERTRAQTDLPLHALYSVIRSIEVDAGAFSARRTVTHQHRPESFMQESLSKSRAERGYEAPLLYGASPIHMTDIIRIAVGRIVDPQSDALERLHLLRAVEGFDDFSEQELRYLLKEQVDLLPKLFQSDQSRDEIVETITRVSLILTSASTASLPDRAVFAAVNETKNVLQSLERDGISTQSQPSQVLFALVAEVANLFSMSVNRKQRETERILLEHMLFFSAMSSVAGSLAAKVLDLALGNIALSDLVPFIERLSHELEAMENTSQQKDDNSSKRMMTHSVGIGAIEALNRQLASEVVDAAAMKLDTAATTAALWRFVRVATSTGKYLDAFGGGPEYELQSALRLLTQLYRRQSRGSPVDIDALMDTLFYPSPSHQDEESALTRSVRRESLEVAEVLAPVHGDELSVRILAVLNIQIRSGSSSTALGSVHRLTNILLTCGCEFRLLCDFFARAAYSESPGTLPSEADLHRVASCCKLLPDVGLALVQCIEVIFAQASTHLSMPTVAKECSSLLMGMEQSGAADLLVIARVDMSLKSELAFVHVLQPAFQNKVTKALESDASEHDLVLAVLELLKSSWASDEKERRKPLTALVGLLPLSVLGAVFVPVLSTEGTLLRLRCLRSLLERMKDDMPFAVTWDARDSSKEDVKPAEMLFMEKVGTALCDVISEFDKDEQYRKDDGSSEVTLLALACLQAMVTRIGSSAPQALLKLVTTPLSGLDIRAASMQPADGFPETEVLYITAALSCLSSFITAMGKLATTFIPRIVGFATECLESTFGKRSRMDDPSGRKSSLSANLMNAALRVCNAVVDNGPKFFGRGTLKRIASIAISTTEGEIHDLLLDATRKLPTSVTMNALTTVTENLENSSAPLPGISILLMSLTVATEVASKTELKSQKSRLIGGMLACLEYGRIAGKAPVETQERNETANGTLDGEWGTDPFNELLIASGPGKFRHDCQIVDEHCGEAITRLALRISESDFKHIFNRVAQWYQAVRIGGDADLAASVDVPHHLVRAVPVFRISLNLMRVLQGIFVPYFVQILDQVLAVVSSKKHELPEDSVNVGPEQVVSQISGKRKRQEWEGNEKEAKRQFIAGLRGEMYETALDNLVQFLSLELTSKIMTPAMVSNVQSSLVTACGNVGISEKIVRAVNGLGLRIVAAGNMSESKEESRELLIGLSRSLLTLSGTSDAAIREASVYYCKSLASTIGDEYLVTLPEAMPVLAELIDDESDDVRRETKSFIKVMEALSGESILEEMKS